MKALSIRQPWVWFILNAGKDVENRDWRHKSNFVGECLLHASSRMSQAEYDVACEFSRGIGVTIPIPDFEALPLGGIVGIVKIIKHVRMSVSPWFVGPSALVLENPYPLPFVRGKGALGFFDFEPIWT